MADQRIQATENMIGANHPTLSDTLNRLVLVGHNADGSHQPINGVTPQFQATGFTMVGGTIPKTLTVDATVSTSTIATLAPLASPLLTGTPTNNGNTIWDNGTSPHSFSGNGGYQKLTSGLIIQCGLAAATGGNITVNLGTAYSGTNNYTIIATVQGSSTGVQCGASSVSSSQMTLYPSNGGVNIFWMTIGY